MIVLDEAETFRLVHIEPFFRELWPEVGDGVTG
jgi:hypothetical protein